MYVSGDATHYVNVGYDGSSPGHSGNYSLKNNSVWSADNSKDTIFYVYTSNLISAFSVTDAGFTAGHPFTSGTAIDYTVQAVDALAAGTYYWRVAATDPSGTNTYGAWSNTRSFTVTAGGDTMTLTIDAGSWINFSSITISQKIANLTTRLKVDTNSADGWTVTAGRDHVGTGILYSRGDGTEINDASTGINNMTDSLPAPCNTETWPVSVDISSGLGFTVWASDTKDTTCWGTGTTVSDTLNKYAAFPASASPATIVGDTNAVPNPSYHSVGYSLEVLNTQKATSYEGDVIFSATTSPP